MHDALTIGIPVLAILLGILWNQQGLRDLRDETASLRNEMIIRFGGTDARIDRVQSDLNGRLDRMQAHLNGRLDRMQADPSQFHRTLGPT